MSESMIVGVDHGYAATFVLSGKSRSVIRGIGRETLKPLQKEVSPMKTKTLKKRGVER